jgi:hypothetical protein
MVEVEGALEVSAIKHANLWLLWMRNSCYLQKWDIWTDPTKAKLVTTFFVSLTNELFPVRPPNDFIVTNGFLFILWRWGITAHDLTSWWFPCKFSFGLKEVLDISGFRDVRRMFIKGNEFIFLGTLKFSYSQPALLKIQIRFDTRLPDHSAKCRFRIFTPKTESPEEQEKCLKWLLNNSDLVPFHFRK